MMLGLSELLNWYTPPRPLRSDHRTMLREDQDWGEDIFAGSSATKLGNFQVKTEGPSVAAGISRFYLVKD